MEIKDDKDQKIDNLDALEIHNTPLEEILADGTKPEDKVEEKSSETKEETETKEEKTKVEEEKDKEVEVTETKTEEKTELNLDEVKDQLRKEISNEVAQQVIESLTGEKKDKSELYPWEKEGRNPTYKEALEYVKDQAKKELMSEFKKEAEDEEKAEEESKKQQEATTQAWNNYWDGQLSELEKAGSIPAVKDAKDKNDDGVKARIELFQLMKDISEERQAQGLPAITNLKEIYYEHYAPKHADKKDNQPAGADAPVAGTSHSVTPNQDKDDFTYTDIHSSSIEDILTGGK